MNRTLKTTAALLSLLSLTLSCKDDEEEEYLSFEGSLYFDVPSYVAPGEIVTMVPKGLRRAAEDSSTDGIGYCWSIDPIATGKDTTRKEDSPLSVTGEKMFRVQDTLCTYTVCCTAFAAGYTASYAYAYPTVVLGGDDNTLTGIKYDKTRDFTDVRDSKTYHATKIGPDVWMSKNLAYASSGVPFAECEAMEDVFGQYYTWDEAQNACPAGWSLPTNADWKALADAVTGQSFRADSTFTAGAGDIMADGLFNGAVMWEYWPANKITDKTAFCSIPSGYAYKKVNDWYFAGAFYYAAYWTADEADSEKAYYRYIFAERPEIRLGIADKKTFAASVRCVKNN